MLTQSNLFRQIVARPDAYDAIRAITHAQPLLVFWTDKGGRCLLSCYVEEKTFLAN